MSTISGNAKTITGLAGRVKVRFDLIHPVFQGGALTLLGSHQVRTEADGDFGLELRAGDYKVFFNEAEYFQIAVPDDDAGYTIDQLVTSEISMPPESPVTGDAPVATANVTGTVKTVVTESSPTVLLAEHSGRTVETLADLIALPESQLTKAGHFEVLGRLTKGDGGGGPFHYDPESSAATNLGTCFAPDNAPGRLMRLWTGALNAKWFAAQGDGANNDTAALQAAAALAVALGQNLYLPAGTYLVNDTILFVFSGAQSPIHVFGDSRKNTVILNSNDAANTIHWYSTAGNVSKGKISNLRVSGGLRGIYSPNHSYFELDEIEIVGTASVGIELTECWLTRLANVYVHENAGKGIHLHSNANSVTIDHCAVYLNDGVGIDFNGGFGLCIGNGTAIETNEGGGIDLQNVTGAWIGGGNYFERNIDAGGNGWDIRIGNNATCNGVVINGNTFTSPGANTGAYSAIVILRVASLEVDRNQILGARYQFGVDLSQIIACTNSRIGRNNYFDDLAASGRIKLDATVSSNARLVRDNNQIEVAPLFVQNTTNPLLPGNLIEDHPLGWTRTVTGASYAKAIAFPAFEMLRKAGETFTLSRTIALTGRLEHLKGKWVNLSANVNASASGTFRLQIDSTTRDETFSGTRLCAVATYIDPSATTVTLTMRVVGATGSDSPVFRLENVCFAAGTQVVALSPNAPVRLPAAPTDGTWAVNQIVFSSAPTTTGALGWVCTASGTPGTWKAFGPLMRVLGTGTATLSGGTVTVANTAVTGNTIVFATPTELAVVSKPLKFAIDAGVGFTIFSGESGDSGDVKFLLVEP